MSSAFQNDKLDLQKFARRFENYLLTETSFVEGSLVVALDAPFGSGKSTFLSMWAADLDERRSQAVDLQSVIRLNSWEDDFCGDPLLSIATAIVRALPREANNGSGIGSKIREAVKDMAWYGAALAKSAVANWTGLDPIEAGKFAKEKKYARGPKEAPDFVQLYENRTAALQKLRETLEEAFGSSTAPHGFVLVDELDRCRPDFAIHYLETIKHVFNIRGLVFVLAVDYAQLASSAKSLFGEGLNVGGYFRRFIHRRVELPQRTTRHVGQLVRSYVGKYLSVDGKRHSILELSRAEQHCAKLISALGLNPRETQEVFRSLGHIAAVEKKSGDLYWGLSALSILFASLRVADSKMYRRIGIEAPSLKEMADFFATLVGDKEALWWFCLYYAAAPNSEQNNINGAAFVMYEKKWIANSTEEAANHALRGMGDGLGHSSNPLKWIYELLEALASFETPLDG